METEAGGDGKLRSGLLGMAGNISDSVLFSHGDMNL